MEEVRLYLNDNGQGSFSIMQGTEKSADMVVGVSHDRLTVYHTEVFPPGEGKGLAKKLLAAMVAYARDNRLTVIPLCPFVHTQFRRNPEMYADIWNEGSEH